MGILLKVSQRGIGILLKVSPERDRNLKDFPERDWSITKGFP
jgi:hypothetical protein